MASNPLRRSLRLNAYDSNGRDFLADGIGWSRRKIDDWITSSAVRPHLQQWYRTCVASPRRFNDAVEWINTGERGYFYNENDLEEDLLLICLSEGDHGVDQKKENLIARDGVSYADDSARTTAWVTQELWARTAWRIVKENSGQGQAFEQHVMKHPAACYGFVIDLLCLAFHSLAFRRSASIYEHLINGSSRLRSDKDMRRDDSNLEEVNVDDDALSTTTVLTGSSGFETPSHHSDGDFEIDERDIYGEREIVTYVDGVTNTNSTTELDEDVSRGGNIDCAGGSDKDGTCADIIREGGGTIGYQRARAISIAIKELVRSEESKSGTYGQIY